MANDSTTGGAILPVEPPALIEDSDLDALFQTAVTAITGLPGDLVRPRWQTVIPEQPEPSVNWCAIGNMSDTADAGPSLRATPGQADQPDAMTSLRHERIELLATFYGPNAKSYAKRLRDGIAIPQNMESLQANQIALISTGPIRSVPEFVNQQWVKRYDFTLSFNRKDVRTYPVTTLVGADIHLFDDTFVNDIIPVPPGS